MIDVILDGRRYPSYMNVDLLKIRTIDKTGEMRFSVMYYIESAKELKPESKRCVLCAANCINFERKTPIIAKKIIFEILLKKRDKKNDIFLQWLNPSIGVK